MFSCEICDRQFQYKNSVNRHFRREHINKESRRRLKCTECDYECRFYQDLRTHLYVEHCIPCKVVHRNFSDFEEFKTWKRKFEETTHFMYVKHSSPKTSHATQERKTYFVCHRTGNFQSGSCGKRKLKRQGSNKINASCPSTMEVVESLADGTVKLVLWSTHVGHDAEVSRAFLSATERDWLAARINEGASYQKIMNEIQTSGSQGGRMSYIKSQDIRNMRKHLINTRNRIILSDIRAWVRNSRTLYYCENNPILFFKDRNVSDPHKKLSSKDIMLILMTEFQEATFREVKPTILCLDDTHCQDSSDFCLISLYGTSVGHAWFPIAYCFTNAVNSDFIKYFLERIRDRFGVLPCTALICDDCPLYFNAWCDVMSPPDNHFLHSWYIEKNWLENVSKIKCAETVRQMVYEMMKLLLTERSEIAFEKRLDIFQGKLKFDTRLSEFWDFFASDYLNRKNMWGGCYRGSVGLDAASESALTELHNKLHEEFNSKLDNQNVQGCLNTLITISHSCEAVLKRIYAISKCEQEEYKERIRLSHKNGVFIKRTQVVETTATKYQIVYKSEHGRDETFDVGFLGEKKCKCVLRCNTCKICIHHYNCTCVDYVANFNICKHIHACAIIRNDIKVDLSAETDAPLDCFVEEVVMEEETICHVDLNVGEDNMVDEANNDVNCESRFQEDESTSSDASIISVKKSSSEEVQNEDESVFNGNLMETNEELSLGSTSSLYYEPFTFVSSDMNDYGQAELQLTEEGLQIVTFRNEDEYEAVLVNEDDSSSFGDVSSVYEDVIPSKGAIITLGFRSDGPDGYIFRPFESNAVIKHKVDSLFTLQDFDDMVGTEMSKPLSSQMINMDSQDFENCYTSYDSVDDEDHRVLGL